jgi:methylenetetrahydrofolate--tRNA-(uracil-5-)-methyltransferase
MAGIFVAMQLHGADPVIPGVTTACGALLGHLNNTETDNFQPMNINYGLFPPLEKRLRKRRERRLAMAERGLADIEGWINAITEWRQTCI